MMKKRAQPKISKNFCYVCGPDNGQGMRLKFSVDEKDAVVRGAFNLAGRYQGPPSNAHGGIIAALVDEAMGKLSRLEGVVALTAELSVEYLHPVPLGRKILVEARPVKQMGRNSWRGGATRGARGKMLGRGQGG